MLARGERGAPSLTLFVRGPPALPRVRQRGLRPYRRNLVERQNCKIDQPHKLKKGELFLMPLVLISMPITDNLETV